MNAYFKIRNYTFPIIPEITYNDLMDGTPDNMSFSFVADENVADRFNIKEKCTVEIYDIPYIDVGTIDLENNELIINNITYQISTNEIQLNGNTVGYILSDSTLEIEDVEYEYSNGKVIKDNKRYYHMCIAQITGEKMSTYGDTGYMITVLLKEQTILLKNCIRTDIAISPSLYPILETTDANGSTSEYNIFNTLLDATLKIIDCHNMCVFNEQITLIDADLEGALLQVACPNLTYRDLSTYSQLYDVFMRVGRVPYLANGVLYGLKLEGNENETTIDVDMYSSISNIKEESTNDNIYSSKIYNNLYDKETAIVPQIFQDMVYTMKSRNVTTTKNLFGLGNVPSSGVMKKIIVEQGDTDTTIKGKIDEFVNNEFRKWTELTSQNEGDISKTLLFVNGYDYQSRSIDDARSYSLELPYNIEDITAIYKCYPVVEATKDADGNIEVYFGWELEKYNNDRLIENTMYEALSTLQKRTIAYYVRGSNKISNVVCLNIPDEGEGNIWDIFTAEGTEATYQGAYAWSMTKVYNQLKKNFFVVEYKPILDTMYTNYDYHKGEENKPLSINNFGLPYSQVTDKQVYPILEYNLEKGLDTTVDLKYITTDTSILNISAGDIVSYRNKKYIINKMSSYINNKSIECSMSLTDNIVQNSIVSSYSDNVRVSSLLSANSVVNRHIHLFSENVIRLMSYYEDGATIRNNNWEFFTQEIGNNLSMKGLSGLGLSNDSENTYKFISKYPFRFDKIIDKSRDGYESGKYYIKMSSNTSADNAQQIELSISDFPVTLVNYTYYVMTPEYNGDSGAITVNTPDELARTIYKFGYYKSIGPLTGLVYSYTSLVVITNNGTRLSPGPNAVTDDEYFNPVSVFSKGKTGNYRFYDSTKEYATTKYGTEKMISTSGKITKIEYAFPSSSYATNVFTNPDLPSVDFDFSTGGVKTKEYEDANIISCTPVLFNTTDEGCKLAGIGNKEEDFYSLYSLPHLSDKGYYLDIRESPRPYIQYKTLFRGSDVIEAKQLSSEIDFMVAGSRGLGSIYNRYAIIKIPKFLNLDNLNLSDNNNEVLQSSVALSTSVSPMSDTESAVITLDDYVYHSDEYDYCLYAYNDQISDVGLKILKFNVVDGKRTNKLCLRSELYSEI